MNVFPSQFRIGTLSKVPWLYSSPRLVTKTTSFGNGTPTFRKEIRINDTASIALDDSHIVGSKIAVKMSVSYFQFVMKLLLRLRLNTFCSFNCWDGYRRDKTLPEDDSYAQRLIGSANK